MDGAAVLTVDRASPRAEPADAVEDVLAGAWDGLAACDLFTVEVLTLAGLRRYLVFFVIDLQSRRVAIAGIHQQPDGAWMEQLVFVAPHAIVARANDF